MRKSQPETLLLSASEANILDKALFQASLNKALCQKERDTQKPLFKATELIGNLLVQDQTPETEQQAAGHVS